MFWNMNKKNNNDFLKTCKECEYFCEDVYGGDLCSNKEHVFFVKNPNVNTCNDWKKIQTQGFDENNNFGFRLIRPIEK